MNGFPMNDKKTVAKSFEVLDTCLGFVARAAMLSRFLAIVLVLCSSLGVLAQEKGAGGVQSKPRRAINLGTDVIKGKVFRPEVGFVTARGDLSFEGLPLEREVLKEVEKSVSKPPF
jgi:hypothetical protein